MALVQLKLRVCRWRGGEGYMWEMCKCRAEQRGSKCGLKCDLVHIAWNARAHPPTVWVGLIRPRHHSKNRMSCWGGIGWFSYISHDTKCVVKEKQSFSDGQRCASWPAILAQGLTRDSTWCFPHPPALSGDVGEGGKCGLNCDLVHIAWKARAHPPTVWINLIRPRQHSKNRMSCWGGIGCFSYISHDTKCVGWTHMKPVTTPRSYWTIRTNPSQLL